MKKNALILVTVEEGNEEAHTLCRKFSSKVYNASNLASGHVAELQAIMKMDKEELDIIGEKIATVYDWLEDDDSLKTYYCLTKGQFLEKPYHNEFKKSYCDRSEYFRKEIFDAVKCRNFVDCGAYEGDTLQKYLTFVNGQFDKISLFEMDSNSVSALKTKIATYDEEKRKKIDIFEVGVGDREVVIPVSDALHEGMSKIDVQGTQYKKLMTLDQCLGMQKVDFIKMDIEGAELAALKGAKELIQKQKPNLAICIYHKLCDLWELPMFIKELVPDYHFYIRHHSHYQQDMVLYAMVDYK